MEWGIWFYWWDNLKIKTHNSQLENYVFFVVGMKTPCYARGSKKLLAMDKKKTPVVQ